MLHRPAPFSMKMLHEHAKPTGISIRGNNNVVRENTVLDAVGAGIRLGGSEVDGIQYGINNEVFTLWHFLLAMAD